MDFIASLAKLSARVHLPVKQRKLRADDVKDFAEAAHPGAVLLGHSDWYLSNVLIPGYWSHAALYTGDSVIEAVGDGVREVPLADWIVERDGAAVVSPTFAHADDPALAHVVNLARSWVKKPYDFDFKINTEAFYCAELVYWAYRQTFPGLYFELRKRLGAWTIAPQDYADATKYWSMSLKMP